MECDYGKDDSVSVFALEGSFPGVQVPHCDGEGIHVTLQRRTCSLEQLGSSVDVCSLQVTPLGAGCCAGGAEKMIVGAEVEGV